MIQYNIMNYKSTTGSIELPVIILCGGLGSRLSTITSDVAPKHLVEINGSTVLDMSASAYRSCYPVILATGRYSDQIESYITAKDLPFQISKESTPLGTSRAVLLAIKNYQLDSSRFVVSNGDEIIPDLNIQELLDFHITNKSECTLLTTSLPPRLRDFAFKTSADYKATSLTRDGDGLHDEGVTFGTGTFVCEPSTIQTIDRCGSWVEFVERMVTEGRLTIFTSSAKFYNLNYPEDLEEIQNEAGPATPLSS